MDDTESLVYDEKVEIEDGGGYRSIVSSGTGHRRVCGE
jgi:hypothetical protein